MNVTPGRRSIRQKYYKLISALLYRRSCRQTSIIG
jgi:hypothetical protein